MNSLERGLDEVVASAVCVCGDEKTDVVDTRHTSSGNIRRRRKCRSCGERWSTLEVRDTSLDALRKTLAAMGMIREAMALIDGEGP